mmetsp:Transcript_35292/g.110918  ORF Transcript_35292/g.110918 Transcript_35292/m.110918 type:complete len:658 (+) Transcript_35292:2003-3976(+)
MVEKICTGEDCHLIEFLVSDVGVVHLLRQRRHDDGPDPLTADETAGIFVEGLAAAVEAAVPHHLLRGQCRPCGGRHHGVQPDRDTSDVGHLLAPERAVAALYRQVGGRTLAGDGDTGAHQTQVEGQSVGLDGSGGTRTTEHVSRGVLHAVVDKTPLHGASSNVGASHRPHQLVLAVATACEGLVGALQGDAVLRVHGDDLGDGDAEPLVVEEVQALHKSTMLRGGAVGVSVLGRRPDPGVVPASEGHLLSEVGARDVGLPLRLNVMACRELAGEGAYGHLVRVRPQVVLGNYPVRRQVIDLFYELANKGLVAIDEDVTVAEAAVAVGARRLQPPETVDDLGRADEDFALHRHLYGLSALEQLLGRIHLVGGTCNHTPLLRHDVKYFGYLVLCKLLQPLHGPGVEALGGGRQRYGGAPSVGGTAGLRQEPAGHRQCPVVARDLVAQEVGTQDDHATGEALHFHALNPLIGVVLLVSGWRKVRQLHGRLRRTQELDDHEPVPHELLQPEGRQPLGHGRRTALVPDPDLVEHAGRSPGNLEPQLRQLVLQEHAHGGGHLVELPDRRTLGKVGPCVEGVGGGRALLTQQAIQHFLAGRLERVQWLDLPDLLHRLSARVYGRTRVDHAEAFQLQILDDVNRELVRVGALRHRDVILHERHGH